MQVPQYLMSRHYTPRTEGQSGDGQLTKGHTMLPALCMLRSCAGNHRPSSQKPGHGAVGSCPLAAGKLLLDCVQWLKPDRPKYSKGPDNEMVSSSSLLISLFCLIAAIHCCHFNILITLIEAIRLYRGYTGDPTVKGSWVGCLWLWSLLLQLPLILSLLFNEGLTNLPLEKAIRTIITMFLTFQVVSAFPILRNNAKLVGNSFPPPRRWPALWEQKSPEDSEILRRRDLTRCYLVKIWKVIPEDCKSKENIRGLAWEKGQSRCLGLSTTLELWNSKGWGQDRLYSAWKQ